MYKYYPCYIFVYKTFLVQTDSQNLRLQKIITVVGILLFLVKIVAWYLTNSVAILTDALEGIVNVIAALIGLYSLYISAKPKDEDHPYGHGKVEYISSAVEGTFIIVAGVVAIYKAGLSIFFPVPLQKLDAGILLIVATGGINYIMGFWCEKIGKKSRSAALEAGGKHLKTDTYTTIGIVIGLILLYKFKYRWIDSAVAILFAFFIIRTGYKIIRSSVAGIMDEADIQLLNTMVEVLNKTRRVHWIDLHNMRIIKYGGKLHLDCHVTVPWYFNTREAHLEIDTLFDLVKDEFGDAIEMFVHCDPCMDFSCKICLLENCPKRIHPFERKIEWTKENISSDKKHQL